MSNFIPPSENGKIVEVDFRELSDHPLLAGIPMWAPDSAEATALRESIRTRGLDYHLLVDNQKRIVDGRNRRNAIQTLGGLGLAAKGHCMNVPCRIVDEHEAIATILDTLLQRRHLSKGARAYLVVPYLEGALAESRKRRIINVTRRASVEQTIGNTADDLAAGLGFGRELIFQARRVRELFEAHAKNHPDLRAKIEPEILSGELGLGGAIVAITNVVHNAERAKRLGKRAQHDRLFSKFFHKVGLHLAKADEAQRQAMWATVRTELMHWPAEVAADFAELCDEVARERAQQAKEAAK